MAAKKRKPKELLILAAALEILKEEGDAGLTMRKLAGRTEMSLSNVQYYFKNKQALLNALVRDYFAACEQSIKETASHPGLSGWREKLTHLITEMVESEHTGEMCAIFREVWAISTRHPALSKQLDKYYRRYTKILCQTLFEDIHPDKHATIGLFLVPYIEGYSIAGNALEKDIDRVIELLCELIEYLLDQ